MSNPSQKYYLGIDMGSYYTKIVVIGEDDKIVKTALLKTLNRDKNTLHNKLDELNMEFSIQRVCATGYGREHFAKSDVVKTEVSCAAYGASHLQRGRKNIIDIGAEDIKIIRASDEGKMEEFYMNNKCAAGTGAFITEIAERAEIDLKQMSELAGKSQATKDLNSFCTVFAKTEIMTWIFNEMPLEDIAKGIYLSIANRIYKTKMEAELPVVVIGGVIAHHPFFKTILSEKFRQDIIVPEFPQFIVAFGASLFAKHHLETNIKNRI